MISGNPAKQDKLPADQVTQAFPPSLSGVITEFGAEAIPFPFVGGKGIQLALSCGPLKLHLVLEPTFADTVCEAIQDAKLNAQSKLDRATMADVAAVAKTG